MIRAAMIIVSLLGAHTIPIPSGHSETIYFENEADENGYHFRYETSDGISRSEQGYFDGENETLRVSGEYQFRFPDGKLIKVTYRADENGYSQKTVPVIPMVPVVPMVRLPTVSLMEDMPFQNRISSGAIASLVGGGLGR